MITRSEKYISRAALGLMITTVIYLLWNATGAVLVGRRTAEIIDHWGGDHHVVPIFVPSHWPPGPSVAN